MDKTYYMSALKNGNYDVYSRREYWKGKRLASKIYKIRARNITEAEMAGRQLMPLIRVGMI